MNSLPEFHSGSQEVKPSKVVAAANTGFIPTDWLLPLVIIALVVSFEVFRTSQESILGLLATVPLISAIFGNARKVSLISMVTLLVTGWMCVRKGSSIKPEDNILFLAVLVISVLSILSANRRENKEEQLREAFREVARLEVIESVADTDWLTGTRNRRGVAQAIEESRRELSSVVMFDIDGLKKVNDSFGHLVGDEYVKGVTSRIAGNFKTDDIFGRWGGDEFIAVLPLSEVDAASVVARVIEAVHKDPILAKGLQIDARVSAGVAPWTRGRSLDQVLTHADQALYSAKAHGGLQVMTYSEFLKTPAT